MLKSELIKLLQESLAGYGDGVVKVAGKRANVHEVTGVYFDAGAWLVNIKGECYPDPIALIQTSLDLHYIIKDPRNRNDDTNLDHGAGIVTLTEETVRKYTKGGALTMAQGHVLGLPYPPFQGWIQSLIGRKLSVEQFQQFIAAGDVKAHQFKKDNRKAIKRMNRKKRKNKLARSYVSKKKM